MTRRLDVVLVLLGLLIAIPAIWHHLRPRRSPHISTSKRHA